MLKRLLKKIFSYEIKYVLSSVATCTVCICGIKYTFKIKDPIYNAKLCNKAGKKTIAILRTDGIGDFLFTRPYIRCIKNSKKYEKYKLVLFGTPQMIELSKKYDKGYINAHITIKNSTPEEEAEFLKEVKKYSFNVIINPCDSKTNYYLEELIQNIKADEKIAHWGYFSRKNLIEEKEKVENILKKYTEVIDTGSDVMYVWDREKIFFEKLLGEKLPTPQKLSEMQDVDLKSDFVTISPFSRSSHRTYSRENFAKIINHITNDLKMPVVILGTLKEYRRASEIKDNCINPDMVYIKTGYLTILESILYIRASKLLVANETGTVHIAQDFGVPTVCISNGSYMNTFQPYPKNESYVRYIYPDDVNKYISAEGAFGHLIYNDINEIKIQKVLDCIDEVLGKKTTV